MVTSDRGHIGVDIGGTTITSACFRPEETEPAEIGTDRREDFSTPADWLEGGVVSRWDTENLPWVLGIPGSVRNQTDIGNTPNLTGAWSGPLLLGALRKQNLSFTLENDANLAALGEATYGAGVETNHLLLLTLGTGIGGGLILDGTIHRGSTGLAGEVGHLVLEPGGRACGCGDVGCFEQYGSATGLRQTYRQLGGDALAADQIVEQADEDVIAHEAVQQTARALGKGIALLINLLEPEMILFSGGLSNSLDRLRPGIIEGRNNHLFASEARQIPLRRAKLDHPALMGTKALIK